MVLRDSAMTAADFWGATVAVRYAQKGDLVAVGSAQTSDQTVAVFSPSTAQAPVSSVYVQFSGDF